MALQQYACLHPSHSITPLSISAQLWRDAVSDRGCHVVALAVALAPLWLWHRGAR